MVAKQGVICREGWEEGSTNPFVLFEPVVEHYE